MTSSAPREARTFCCDHCSHSGPVNHTDRCLHRGCPASLPDLNPPVPVEPFPCCEHCTHTGPASHFADRCLHKGCPASIHPTKATSGSVTP